MNRVIEEEVRSDQAGLPLISPPTVTVVALEPRMRTLTRPSASICGDTPVPPRPPLRLAPAAASV
jgi:hypothetical protein